MTIDARRALRALALAVWAGFFLYLRVTGEMTRYLGPRTYWVVTFGAIVLTAATLAHLPALRRTGGRSASVGWRDIATVVIVTAPVLAVLSVPDAELGALAASKKLSSAGGSQVGALAPPAPDPNDPIDFADVHFANESESYAASAGIAEGGSVDLTGFVSGAGSDGSFVLTRFYVSCCAADALPYSVQVDPENLSLHPSIDEWLRVQGVLGRTAEGYVVRAPDVTRVPEPRNPYLY